MRSETKRTERMRLLAAFLVAAEPMLPLTAAHLAAIALLERQHEILSALRGKVVASA